MKRSDLGQTFAKALAFHRQGNLAEAERRYSRILKDLPDHFDARHLLGVIRFQQGQNLEAFRLINAALISRPNSAEAFSNLGLVLDRLRRHTEAIVSFDKAIAIKPDYPEAHYNRGVSLKALSRIDEALASYDRALAIRPNYADALTNRGIALHNLGRYNQALDSFERAIALNPSHHEALNGRGNLLLDQANIDEAIASYRKARVAAPDNPAIHSNLIFALNFDPAATAEEHQAERARWNAQHARGCSAAIRPHLVNPNQDRRIRIGYVSSHFRHQAATYAFAAALLYRDRKRFEVVCYSDTAQEDEISNTLRGCANIWRETAALSDDELSEVIRSDKIDILVDLVGHMRGNRLLVFARKPAPIQVTGWGEPTGTGLNAIDYLLADPVLVPASERRLLVEEVIELPNFLGYWSPDSLPEPGQLPALARGYISFGSFNRLAKIQQPVLRAWASILREVPNARLVLKDRMLSDAAQCAHVATVLANEGVAAERIKFVGATSRDAHFAAYQDIDIALDPFPHGGGMTTIEALIMGVPVITFAGRTISSRLAAASLTAIGLTDFIAANVSAYIDLAAAKASDQNSLSLLRSRLRECVTSSAFGNCGRYAHSIESAYLSMWQKWISQNRTHLR